MPGSEAGPAPVEHADAGSPVPSPATAEAVGLHTHPLTAVTTGMVYAVPATIGLLFSVLQNGDAGWVASWLGALVVVGLLLAGLAVGTAIGYVTWRFTRYVIDGTELRITSGVLTKSSRRIPYERIQSVDIAEPLLARLLGLAELRIEMAGGDESRTSLRFLALDDAKALRRVLTSRAQGRTGGSEEPAEEVRDVIVRVPPGRLVLATLLTVELATAVVASVVLLGVALWFDQVLAFIGGIVPVLSWLAQIIARRVVTQWDFTLSEGERGLRIERGLFSRTSQTIPADRVQGVAVEEPVAWRQLGWVRLEVDVAGYASTGSDDGAASSSTLLPIGDAALAAAVLDRVLPGARPDLPDRTAASPRSWPFAPVGWRYRSVGADDRVFVAREGWMMRRTSVVPHRKTQSVELRQGPLQRLRRVATVEVHTPRGPVDADGRHLEAETARGVALDQLGRARAARA